MKAYELLSSPEKWTQVYWAKDKDGVFIWPKNENAVCWCALGAIARVYADSPDEYDKAKTKLNDAIEDKGIVDWNDDPERTWEDVYTTLKELDI